MSRFRRLSVLVAVAGLGVLLLSLEGCGGSSSPSTPSNPSPNYTLGAGALNPNTVTAGGTATSTVTVTPSGGYTGSVTLSCSSVTGGSPEPSCGFETNPITISGTAPVTSTLTVSTTSSTPGGNYAITVSAVDANNVAPSNGAQSLTMITTAVIQHVVIIFQENRTPDNLFQGLCMAPYGSAGACSSTPSSTQYNLQNFGIDSTGAKVPLVPLDLGTSGANPLLYDLSHAHSAFTSMCDLNTSTNTCKMDGADLIVQNCEGAPMPCGPQPPQFVYVNPADVVPYIQMAQAYTFGDQMFQTNQGPSFPAHQFIFGGTSEPSTSADQAGLFVSENPLYVTGTTAGCVALATTTVKVINALGEELDSNTMYPCTDHQTLADEMDAANPPVTWRYYAPSQGSIWTAPTAISHICQSDGNGDGGNCQGPDYTGSPAKVYVNEGQQSGAQVLTDIANNQLQQVSWVIPAGQFSDHAYSNTGCGPSWVTSVVDAIGTSPYWANTVIIVAWDDWGGWYDHVPPPQIVNDGTSWGSGYVYGFRVPIMVISPYIAKSGYISHNTHDFGSILRYMENTFALPSLGFADANAPDDLSDFFNLSQTPIGFTTIPQAGNFGTCTADSSLGTDPDDD